MHLLYALIVFVEHELLMIPPAISKVIKTAITLKAFVKNDGFYDLSSMIDNIWTPLVTL